MKIVRLPTAEAFLARAQVFLLEDEATNNLLLGIPANLINSGKGTATGAFYVMVEDAGTIVATACMTPPRQLVLSHVRRSEALEPIVKRLRAEAAPVTGVNGPVAVSARFAELWSGSTGATARHHRSLRIFRLETVETVSGIPGRMRQATETDRDLLAAWRLAFAEEALGETSTIEAERTRVDRFLNTPGMGLFAWENQTVVSIASASGATPHGIRIGGVYTPPEERGRGYASTLVASLSQHLLGQGRRFCFLYTDLANPTSNRIYQRIGYRPVCDVDEYRFGDAPRVGV